MSDESAALIQRERRLARRLARLFRAERSGRLARRPPGTVARLVERRGAVVAELASLEARRRSLFPWATGELDFAMAALAKEAERTEQHCHERLAEIGTELERRRGARAGTGLRDGAAGRLLGRG